jgi:hypothetical protein
METPVTKTVILDIIHGLKFLQNAMFWKLLPLSAGTRGEKVTTTLHPLARASLSTDVQNF